MLRVRAPGRGRVAVEQRRAVERREQPLVRVDHERVGALDAAEPVAHARRGERRRARTRRRRGPTCRARARRRRRRRGRRSCRCSWCPPVATTAHTDVGVGVGVERGAQRRAGEPVVVTGRHDERIDVHDPQRVDERRVGLVARARPASAPAGRGARAAAARAATSAERLPAEPPDTKHPPAAGGKSGEVGDPAQRLVLGVDRAGGLEPVGRRRSPTPRPRCRRAGSPSSARTG